jgi:hypothetical protein
MELYTLQPNLPEIPEHLILKDPELIRKIPDNFPYPNPTYSTHDVSPVLRIWLQKHFDFKFYVNYQVMYRQLPIHIDIDREVCYNYIIDTGGDNVKTRWYDDSQTTEIHSVVVPERVWHKLDVSKPHDISEVSRPRFSITVWPA